MEYQYRDQYGSSGFTAVLGTIGAMIFGALIGASVALLMAPKSGPELRSDLKQGASRMGERISETSHEVVDSLRDKVGQIGREAERIGDKAQRYAKDLAEGSDNG